MKKMNPKTLAHILLLNFFFLPENESKDSGSSLAGLDEVLDSLLAIPTSSHSVSPSSRSHLYLEDESDSDVHRNVTPIDGINHKPSKQYHGTISDHLLASTVGQSSTDDDTSFSLLDKEHYQSQRSLGLATPSPKQQTQKPNDTDVQELHVHWGPEQRSSSLLDITTTNDIAKDPIETETDIGNATTNSSDVALNAAPVRDAMKLRRGSEQLRNLLPDDLLVRCSYPNCAKTVEWVEARRSFKTCHNCYTYYCNRECRRIHWEKHRRTCMYSRIRSLCKHVILRSRDDPTVQAHLTKLARTGMISQGRGFVKLAFRNPELVERFLQQGWQALEDNPIYVAWRDLLPQELGAEISHQVTELCKQYNPESKLILLAAVYLTREIPEQPVPRWEREVIAKCAKVTLRKFGSDDYSDSLFEPDTLILTAVPQPSDVSPDKARERCLNNILRHLRQRGVSLRHQFPDVFEMLTAYVEQNQIFPAITIYPKDGRTGKTFMCLIMPNTEPEIEEMINDFSRK
uniref:Apical junction molecule ajm1 alpha/beta domain-containing protein n=1 Tax=Strigamia maritima TaxID=126957 RepID=T1J727_STRMM